jgi:hypothetical protein
MKYLSEHEKQFVNDAVKSETYRIDHTYKTVSPWDKRQHGYNFHALGVTSKNSDRYIVRAFYRKERQQCIEERNACIRKIRRLEKQSKEQQWTKTDI